MNNDKRTKRNQSKQLAFAILAALVIVAPFAAANTVPNVEDPESAVDEPEWVVNLLVIDGKTGDPVSWDDNGVPFTDVRVTNVASAGSGYNLWSPIGEALFLNQTSTFAGYVEFYNQVLTPGTYRVTHTTETGNKTVVDFDASAYAAHIGDAYPEDAPSVRHLDVPEMTVELQEKTSHSHGNKAPAKSSGNVKSDGSKPNSDAGCGSSGAYLRRTETKLSEKTLWTPLVVAHAPYLGSGSASTSWQSGKGIFVSTGYANYQYSSSRTTTFTVDVDVGGSTGGAFQLAKWGYYKVTATDRCGWTYTSYMAKVIDWAPTGSSWVKTFDLWGSSKTTDADDAESYSYSGYGSVGYKTRYRVKDRMVETSAGTGVTASVSSGTYSKFDTTIGFSQGSVTLKTTLQATSGSTAAWTYSFPKGANYCWHIDYLGDGSTGGWAFKYMGSSGC